MALIISIVLFFILFALGMLHFYWAIGGKWALEGALPQSETGKIILTPKPFASIIVGIGLVVFGLFVLIKSKIIFFDLPVWLNQYGLLFLSFLFVARAIGDFKYVGFFKKIKKTSFGILDTKVYSPLCVFIGILLFIIEII